MLHISRIFNEGALRASAYDRHLVISGAKVTLADGEGRSCEEIALSREHAELAKFLKAKHNAVTDARDKAMKAANAAAYAAAAAERKNVIPLVSAVDKVIANGLVSLAIAGDIISGGQEGGANADNDEEYIKKNLELESQLGDVERKLRLDRLYAKGQKKADKPPRVYF